MSTTIDRPARDVFRFCAVEHVKNHPRWDPDMRLEAETPGPVGVGSVIRRRATRGGRTIEGTMRITEFEPDSVMGAVVQDGPGESRGRMLFERTSPTQTRLTLSVDAPAIDDEAKATMARGSMERSLSHIKRLVEAETPKA